MDSDSNVITCDPLLNLNLACKTHKDSLHENNLFGTKAERYYVQLISLGESYYKVFFKVCTVKLYSPK